MKKNWEVEADGVMHKIQFNRVFRNQIIVDGETYKVKSSNWFINILDYEISFGSTICKLVVIGNKVDLAVNGTYLGSKKPYTPVSNAAPWIWVLVGISVLGGYLLSGPWSLVVGLLMGTLYIRFGMEKKTGSVIGCFIGCSLIQFLILIVLLYGRGVLH